MSNYLDARGRPRIVITGMGAVTPVGNTVDEAWRNVVAGNSGIGPVTQFDAADLPCRIAGEVRDFAPRDYMDYKESRRMSRASQLATAAGRMALDDAGLAGGLPDPERTGVAVGAGVGGFERADAQLTTYRTSGLSRVNPFALTSSLANMPSHHISVMAGTLGPIVTPVAACATGVTAVGEGAEFIRSGRADLVIVGGVEGLIHEAALAGFAAMRALSTAFNEDPARACRPFDADRDGFILSEGAGVLVLERLDHAIARGARIYAEFLGHASSSDAFHVAAPDPEGKGAVRAMRWSLEDAGVALEEVDYINAHGTSTPVNDATETLAIKTLFGEYAYEIAISSTKSVMGHAMGGAGALETIFTALTVRDDVVPPTINYETVDPDCDLDYVPNVARQAAVSVAMCNSFGLGGQNACLVLKKYTPPVSNNGFH